MLLIAVKNPSGEGTLGICLYRNTWKHIWRCEHLILHKIDVHIWRDSILTVMTTIIYLTQWDYLLIVSWWSMILGWGGTANFVKLTGATVLADLVVSVQFSIALAVVHHNFRGRVQSIICIVVKVGTRVFTITILRAWRVSTHVHLVDFRFPECFSCDRYTNSDVKTWSKLKHKTGRKNDSARHAVV